MPSLNIQIFVASIMGVVLGIGVSTLESQSALKVGLLYSSGLVGGLFIDLLKMVLIPLVFTSIVVGVANLQAHRQVNRVWKLTLAFFLISMALALALALAAANLVKPGANLSVSLFADAMQQFSAKQLSPAEFLVQFSHSLFQNPFAALAQGNILAVVVFALFIGVALVMAGNQAQRVAQLFQELLELMMRIVGWIMRLAPLGILALLMQLIAVQQIALLTTLGGFMLLVIMTTLIHGAVILPLLLYLVTKKSPLWFWRGARAAIITAFATSSSAATLPISLRSAQQQLGAGKDIAGFVLPLGATMNMDGTALYEAVAALFIANLMGIDLSLGQQLIVCAIAMIASMGAPGIPSAGMVTMVLVLQSVGLPAEAIAILLPVDRLLDTVRTAVNVEGDLVATLVVERLTNPPAATA
jgi:Na+/H+-dicarboxylate symporter